MSTITRKFTRDELGELDIPWGRKAVVHTEQVDEGRWQTHHIAIFRTEENGPLWEVAYQQPATEQQECDRWYDEDTVTATQVEPYTVEVIKYRPVAEPSGEGAAEPVPAKEVTA